MSEVGHPVCILYSAAKSLFHSSVGLSIYLSILFFQIIFISNGVGNIQRSYTSGGKLIEMARD